MINKSILIELTKRDFTERYSGSILGMLWTFIWPLVTMLVYFLVFSKIMGAKLPGRTYVHGYGVYLIAGLAPWTTFASTITRISSLFVDKKHLITKINISLPTFPIYIVISETITFIITIFIYFIFLVFLDVGFHKTLLFLPFVFVSQQIFAYALGFFIATLQVFIRDLREVVGIVLFVWFWLNPIVYVFDILPEYVKSYIVYNPAFWFISAYQNIFVFHKPPNFHYLILLTILGHTILIIGYLMFKQLEKDLRDFI
jgi:lipopolysaccharide transport system permease protein